jgi:phage terminase large subunit-like protein
MPTTDNPVDAYAKDVSAGRVPAGKYHRLACERHLRDRKREAKASYPFVFDFDKAAAFIRFAQKLKHYKGEWAGQPITLSPFQVFRLGCIFGWRVKADPTMRRFTTAYNELPRKQGKSLEAAVVAIYTTFFEGEPGAEGYCLATKEKQAADVVFRDIKRLIQSSGLTSRLRVQVKNIHHEASASKLEPLGSDSDTLDGLNPHSITTDELHAFKNRGLLDVMESATGARRNPLHYQITTAGDDPVSVCGDQHDYACKILDRVIEDAATESFFCCIAHADPEDDWLSEATWRKANPHYGISVKPDDMLKLALKAKNMPSAAAEFKQKRLSVWVNATSPCLSVDGWRRGQSDWNPEAMRGQSCYVGIDLASKIDLAAMSVLFPPTEERPTWRLFQHVWTPEDTLAERAHRDRAPYQVWAEQGWLTTTPGTRLDAQAVREAVIALRDTYGFDVERIGFDPWHSDQLITQLVNEDGFAEDQVLAVPQTFAGMSSACLHLQAEILDGKVDARGCPVTAWAVSNVAGQRDGKDNLMFAKGKSRGRIDPVIAATIAMALKLKNPAEGSVYEERGVLTL